jgi:hypothetical protein
LIKTRSRRAHILAENICDQLQPNTEAQGAVCRLNALSRVPEKCGPAMTGKLDGHVTALRGFGDTNFWSRRTLTELLKESAFEVVRFQGIGRVPFLWKVMVLVARKP